VVKRIDEFSIPIGTPSLIERQLGWLMWFMCKARKKDVLAGKVLVQNETLFIPFIAAQIVFICKRPRSFHGVTGKARLLKYGGRL